MSVTDLTPEERADIKAMIEAPSIEQIVRDSRLPISPGGVNLQVFHYDPVEETVIDHDAGTITHERASENSGTPHEQPKHDPDEYRNLLLLTLANRVLRMTDASAEIAELRAEIAQLRKVLKAAFLAIGHGNIGKTFEPSTPRAVVNVITEEDNDIESGRSDLTEDLAQEVIAKLKE